jgi:hypothetical protein
MLDYTLYRYTVIQLFGKIYLRIYISTYQTISSCVRVVMKTSLHFEL